MERLSDYKKLVEKVVNDRSNYKAFGEIEVQTIFDRERDHFELVNLGWNGLAKICGCLLHIDIKDGNIWIRHDGTDDGAATDLVEMGAPKSDIVPTFHPPYKRKYTGFAEA
jgi:XisI protein